MKIIKVTFGAENTSSLLLRQTPANLGIWGGCKYIVNEHIAECDWWIVCHGSSLKEVEKTKCDPDHIIYISMEPNEDDDSIKNGFLDQFSKIVICDRDVKHKKIKYMNGMTWWVGMNMEYRSGSHHFSSNHSLDFDKLSSMCFPLKNNRISVIVSNKSFMPGHQARLIFLNKLMTYPIAKYIDIYGGGFNPIPDKWDVIAPYKFHLVLENSVKKDYWSEKLADAFLGFSLPIYYGCPNIYDYFSKDSLLVIDINDVESAADLLQRLINGDGVFNYNKNLIEQSRSKILHDYNIFQMMSLICDQDAKVKVKCILKPKRYFTGSILKRILKRIISFWY